MTIQVTSKLILLCSSLLIAHGGGALAQDALGGGNVLDSNLSATGGRINQPRAQENYRDRNLIVTGDVAGGRGFRGSVGYTAAADFRGRTGSNEIFPFLADSAFSSPGLLQLGSTYEQLRFGQTLGALEYRRAQSGDPASIHADLPVSMEQIGETIRNDRQRTLDRTSLASSSQFKLQNFAEPQIIGVTYDQENRPLLYNASGLRGITIEPMAQSVNTIGLSTMDAARLREDVEAGRQPAVLGSPFQTPFESGLPKRETPEEAPPGSAMRVGSSADGGRIDGSIQADYARILERVAEQYAETRNLEGVDPATLKGLQEEYMAVRDTLRGTRNLRQSTRVGELTQAPTDTSEIPGAMAQPERRPTQPGLEPPIRSGERPARTTEPVRSPGAEPARPEPPAGQPTAPDTSGVRARLPAEMGSVLRHGQRVERLSGEEQDRFNELIESAERELREGAYFVAERKFERALRFIPGHPFASVGSAHAQIGGGLYLSAALSLRNLLITQPEMIDTTFSPDLLPNKQRLDAAITTLRSRAQENRDRAGYAFLLAYLGHQIGDRALVQEGLDIMQEANPQDELLPLLREIWLTPRRLREAPPAAVEPGK